jgi:hypothetical protein
MCLYPTLAAASLLTNLFVLLQLTSSLSGVADLLPQLPKTSTSSFYAAKGLIFVALAATTMFSPHTTSSTILLLQQTIAPGFWLAGVIAFVLQDAAERGRLAASTFRRLNAGLLAFCATYAFIEVQDKMTGGGGVQLYSLLQLSFLGAVFCFCSFQYLVNKKAVKA